MMTKCNSCNIGNVVDEWCPRCGVEQPEPPKPAPEPVKPTARKAAPPKAEKPKAKSVKPKVSKK